MESTRHLSTHASAVVEQRYHSEGRLAGALNVVAGMLTHLVSAAG